MRLKALMHDLFKTCGTNSKTVSVNMGRDQSFLSAALMRPAIRTDTLCEIADIVGYEVVLRPKRSPSKRARNPDLPRRVHRNEDASAAVRRVHGCAGAR